MNHQLSSYLLSICMLHEHSAALCPNVKFADLLPLFQHVVYVAKKQMLCQLCQYLPLADATRSVNISLLADAVGNCAPRIQ